MVKVLHVLVHFISTEFDIVTKQMYRNQDIDFDPEESTEQWRGNLPEEETNNFMIIIIF